MPRVHLSGPAEARGLSLLLGWAGGAARSVQKHAAAWHRAGWRTATAEMTIDMSFFPSVATALPALVDELLAEARSHRRRSDSLLVAHCFSNAGLFALTSMLRRDAALEIDGAVYDSAPSPESHIRPWAAPMVIAASARGGSRAALLAKHVPYALGASLVAPFVGVPPPIGFFADVRDPSRNRPRPELFLYSPADALVPAAGIEEFMRARRQLPGGAAQASCRFDGSAHVAHFKRHPEQYEAAVGAFAAALAEGRPPAAPRAKL